VLPESKQQTNLKPVSAVKKSANASTVISGRGSSLEQVTDFSPSSTLQLALDKALRLMSAYRIKWNLRINLLYMGIGCRKTANKTLRSPYWLEQARCGPGLCFIFRNFVSEYEVGCTAFINLTIVMPSWIKQ